MNNSIILTNINEPMFRQIGLQFIEYYLKQSIVRILLK